MKILGRLVAACVAVLAAWLGLCTTATAAVEPSPAPVAIGAHDSVHHAATPGSAKSERGPPARSHCVTACEAVGHRSHGASACPHPTVPCSTTTYTTPADFARAARATGTTRARGQADAGALSSFARSDVAAEGASSGLTISEKIAGQMGPRGWSESLMKETIDSPAARHTVWDFTSGTRQAATAYARADGSYVVVNDATGAVVQISDINKVGWKPVWDDPRFKR